MREGGIYDKVERGLFRYSTTSDWGAPHYEKLCEDNAKLLVNYLETFQVTGDESFKEAAQETLAYVAATLSDRENGGFYGSQDADEEYYRLDALERKGRTAPRVDKTLHTNWNALMISAHFLASAILGEPARALKCLIGAYQFTSDRKFLAYAEAIAEFVLKNLWDVAGGFYDKPKDPEAFGALKTLSKPLDENSVASDALLRLYHLTGKETYLEHAQKTLEYNLQSYNKYSIMAASYGLAVESYLHSVQMHIVGFQEERLTREFLDESLRAYNPLKLVQIQYPAIDTEMLKKLKYPVDEKPKAYVCLKGTCTLVEDPKDIPEKLS